MNESQCLLAFLLNNRHQSLEFLSHRRDWAWTVTSRLVIAHNDFIHPIFSLHFILMCLMYDWGEVWWRRLRLFKSLTKTFYFTTESLKSRKNNLFWCRRRSCFISLRLLLPSVSLAEFSSFAFFSTKTPLSLIKFNCVGLLNFWLGSLTHFFSRLLLCEWKFCLGVFFSLLISLLYTIVGNLPFGYFFGINFWISDLRKELQSSLVCLSATTSKIKSFGIFGDLLSSFMIVARM